MDSTVAETDPSTDVRVNEPARSVQRSRLRRTILIGSLAVTLAVLGSPFVAAQPDPPTAFAQDRWLGADGDATFTATESGTGDIQQVRERAHATFAELAATLPADVLVAITDAYSFDPGLLLARDLTVTTAGDGTTSEASVSVSVRTDTGDRQVAEYSQRADRSGTFALTFNPPLLTFPAFQWDPERPELLEASVSELGSYDETGVVSGLGTYHHSAEFSVDDAAAGCISSQQILQVFLEDDTLAGEVINTDGWCADGSVPGVGGDKRYLRSPLHAPFDSPAAAATGVPDTDVLDRLTAQTSSSTAVGDGPIVAAGDVFVRTSMLAGDLVARWSNGATAWEAHPGGRVTAVSSDGELIVAATSAPAVAVYDATGTRQWLQPVDDLAADVLVAGGHVFVATLDGSVTVFSADDGTQLWTTTPADTPLALAAAGDDGVALADASGAITVFDAASGRRRWEADMAGVTRLAATATHVYALDGFVVDAFDAASGDLAWTAPANADRLVVAGDVVWALGDRDVTAVDAQTGAVRIRTGGVDAFTVFGDGTLLGVTAGELRVFRVDGDPPGVHGDVCADVALSAAGSDVVGWCGDGSWITTVDEEPHE